MKKIKVALLGCGHRGNTYVSYGKKYPEELEVVALIDISPVALKTTGDEYGVPENRRFSSLDEFINAKNMFFNPFFILYIIFLFNHN